MGETKQAKQAQSWQVVTELKKLTVEQYITCDCDKDYSVLIINGTPPDDVLYNAWVNLSSLYVDMVKDSQTAYEIDAIFDEEGYKLKEFAVLIAADILNFRYDERVCDAIKELGFEYALSEDSYQTDMDCIKAELGSEALMFLTDQTTKPEPVTGEIKRERYYLTIAALNKEYGICFGLSPVKAAKEITMYEYALFYKQFVEKQKLLKSKYNKSQLNNTEDGDD